MKSLSFEEALDKFAKELDHMCKCTYYGNKVPSLHKDFDQAEKLEYQKLKHMVKVFGFQTYFNSCKKYFEYYHTWEKDGVYDEDYGRQPHINELKKQIAPAVKRLLVAKGKL